MPRLQFKSMNDFEPSGQFEVVYTNGVFHHVEPEERLNALGYVHRSLSQSGYFGFWENNPWNPGTRLVMGFDVLRTDFLFLFPRVLSALRPIEASLARFPAGAQYMVLCRKSKS